MKNIRKPKEMYRESTQELDMSYLEMQENDTLSNREFLYEESLYSTIELYEQLGQ